MKHRGRVDTLKTNKGNKAACESYKTPAPIIAKSGLQSSSVDSSLVKFRLLAQ